MTDHSKEPTGVQKAREWYIKRMPYGTPRDSFAVAELLADFCLSQLAAAQLDAAIWQTLAEEKDGLMRKRNEILQKLEGQVVASNLEIEKLRKALGKK